MKYSIILLLFLSTSVYSQSKEFSFVFLNINPNAPKLEKAESDKIMEGHMGNITKLAKEGRLISAGPFEGGGGIFILNTTSVDEAKGWLQADPGIQANRWKVEILPYKPLIRSACLVQEPYEMVLHQFLRYSTDNTADEKSALNSLVSFLQKDDNIITHGAFGDSGQGIIVLKNKLDATALNTAAGKVKLEIKIIYIANGAFCE